MEKIAQYLEHACDCMEMAAKTWGPQSDALVRIAEHWTVLARERREHLEVHMGAAHAALAYPEITAPKCPSIH